MAFNRTVVLAVVCLALLSLCDVADAKANPVRRQLSLMRRKLSVCDAYASEDMEGGQQDMFADMSPECISFISKMMSEEDSMDSMDSHDDGSHDDDDGSHDDDTMSDGDSMCMMDADMMEEAKAEMASGNVDAEMKGQMDAMCACGAEPIDSIMKMVVLGFSCAFGGMIPDDDTAGKAEFEKSMEEAAAAMEQCSVAPMLEVICDAEIGGDSKKAEAEKAEAEKAEAEKAEADHAEEKADADAADAKAADLDSVAASSSSSMMRGSLFLSSAAAVTLAYMSA